MDASDDMLFGHNPEPGLVALEPVTDQDGREVMRLFFREGDRVRTEEEPFRPFLWADTAERLQDAPASCEVQPLAGEGALRVCARFEAWKDFKKVEAWLKKASSAKGNDLRAPFFSLNDPTLQHLMTTGRTLFKGMGLDDVRRMQFDLETYTEPGFEFSNPEREGDRIIAIAMADSTGWTEVLSGAQMDEKTLLETFVQRVRERDPDVLETHNGFRFDWPYLKTRARRCKVRLRLGRDGSEPKSRPSRFTAAERTVAYTRFDCFGRHLVDTYLLALAYDVTHRTLEGHGLKDVAIHFGVAAPERTYLEGSRIAETFEKDPERLMRYARDDVIETRAVAALLSSSYFVQAQLLPFTYQNVCVRGNATKIDALMLRAYVRAGQSLPLPGVPHAFEGGYTDVFFTGVARNVHHCDVRSLYPSLMLKDRIGPRTDTLGFFLKALAYLRDLRLEVRDAMKQAADPVERQRLNARQTTFKILINSFYGYLGFDQARFGDFDAAERIASEGRMLLRAMVERLRELGARPIEIDTDGLYFIPPEDMPADRFQAAFQEILPEGIEVEFDGVYRAMFSYKMKNYALLDEQGELVVKGAALKSRGLERFQREFIASWLRLKLKGREEAIPELASRMRKAIEDQQWPIEQLAKTETLQESPERYLEKQQASRRGRSAVYELALKSNRPYRAGDPLSYYVTGTRKSVAVHEAAKPVADWDPAQRDENVAYYLAKFDGLVKKFAGLEADEGATHEQTELDWG